MIHFQGKMGSFFSPRVVINQEKQDGWFSPFRLPVTHPNCRTREAADKLVRLSSPHRQHCFSLLFQSKSGFVIEDKITELKNKRGRKRPVFFQECTFSPCWAAARLPSSLPLLRVTNLEKPSGYLIRGSVPLPLTEDEPGDDPKVPVCVDQRLKWRIYQKIRTTADGFGNSRAHTHCELCLLGEEVWRVPFSRWERYHFPVKPLNHLVDLWTEIKQLLQKNCVKW